MVTTERVDAVVVGAGIVGLAVARALARRQREVIVLEASDRIGAGISSRSSEVIHAGIYYPAGSLKARLCVEGRDALYAYCASRAVPHRRCGKLIVAAAEEEEPALAELARRAADNGVRDLEWLTPAQVREIEPHVACRAAVLSPSTGIVDSHALMLSLTGEIEQAAGHVVLSTRVTGLVPGGGAVAVVTDADGGMALEAEVVVLAAGLGATDLARRTRGFSGELIPPAFYCKGSYFVLRGARPFGRLVYPVPERHGLGVHATIDLDGAVRFGPDTEWVDREDYGVDPSRAAHFYSAIRRYYPGLADGSLAPGYAGIRPKTSGPDGGGQDFQVLGPRAHGIDGLAVLFGIESPGLTACLAVAEHVATLLDA